MTDDKDNTPKIRIAGVDIPAHLAWEKIEVLNTSADLLERLNETYPHLATDFTHEIIPLTRDRLNNSIGDLKAPPEVGDKDDFTAYLKEQLATHDPAEVADLAKRDRNVEMSLEDLIYFVGEENYMDAMQRQANEFVANRISYNQICELWNQGEMPAPGKAHWTFSDVEKMLGPEPDHFTDT